MHAPFLWGDVFFMGVLSFWVCVSLSFHVHFESGGGGVVGLDSRLLICKKYL